MPVPKVLSVRIFAPVDVSDTVRVTAVLASTASMTSFSPSTV
jgi:hypothetical protein